MRRALTLLTLALATLALACATTDGVEKSDTKPTPEAETSAAAEQAVEEMTWKDVRGAMANGAVVVDARGAASFAKGHIPGAISVPLRKPAPMERLPKDLNTELIFYCGGPRCTASTQVMAKAVAAGYTRCSEFKGGFPAWKAHYGLDGSVTREAHAGIEVIDWTATEAAMQAGGILIDSRSPKGFAKGHIAGAINVPYRDEAAHSALPEDKATTLVFYCSGPACSASTKGAAKAVELGYSSVKEYRGGFPDWASRQ